MSVIDARSVPADPLSTERLRSAGLSYRLIGADGSAALDGFIRAEFRGFLEGEPTEELRKHVRETAADRRMIGVFAEGAAAEDLPIATTASWVTPLTVPGGEIDMWAISSVTVAATHRRRGIARNLLEGELRAAASAGIAIAGLTASEATIYGRYGFAPAVPALALAIDTRRAGWIAPADPGRLEYVAREAVVTDLQTVHERERRQRSGQVSGWTGRWRGMAGLAPGDKKADDVRAVRYVDAGGEVHGILVYTLDEIGSTERAELSVRHLAADTPEALRSLWGFAVRHDLVDRVSADLRPLDDPLRLLVADERAVEAKVHDHGWLRVIDVPAALQGRRYRADLELVVRVDDPLGFATGTWRVSIRDGAATVVATAGERPAVAVDVATLSALYAGGVSAAQLRAAGRLETSAEIAESIDDAFRAPAAPLLGIWY